MFDYPDQNSGELNTFPSGLMLDGYNHLSETLFQRTFRCEWSFTT
jgi:hypothetical protein